MEVFLCVCGAGNTFWFSLWLRANSEMHSEIFFWFREIRRTQILNYALIQRGFRINKETILKTFSPVQEKIGKKMRDEWWKVDSFTANFVHIFAVKCGECGEIMNKRWTYTNSPPYTAYYKLPSLHGCEPLTSCMSGTSSTLRHC